MPEEPVFKVSNKMFKMLSDWQDKIDNQNEAVPDTVATSETSAQVNSPPESLDKSARSEKNNSVDS